MASDEIPEPSSVNMGKRPAPDEHAPAENQGLDAPKASDERPKKKTATKTKGEKLFDEITETPEAFVYVEVSLSGRAKCRAGRDCLHVKPLGPQTQQIKDEFRICVFGTDMAPFGDGELTKHYYHVICFSAMVYPEDLIPSNKFRLYNGKWGLLVRKWYEHRGCIDVDVISDYIAAHKTYEKKLQKCTQDESAQPSTEPTLSDYTTGDTVSHCLWDILNHEDSEEMKATVPKFSLYD